MKIHQNIEDAEIETLFNCLTFIIELIIDLINLTMSLVNIPVIVNCLKIFIRSTLN